VRRAKRSVVVLKGFKLILEIHDWRQVQDALHDMSQRRGERDAAVASSAQDPLRVGLVEFDAKRFYVSLVFRFIFIKFVSTGAMASLNICSIFRSM